MYLKVIFCYHLYFHLLKSSENIQPTALHTINQKQKICVRISPQVILMLPNALLQRNFQMEEVIVLTLRGADKFRIEVLHQLYDCLVIQLCKRIDPYEQIAKRFKFLSELVSNSEIDEDSIKLIIKSYYKDNTDHKLGNECYQFKEYLHLRKSQNTEENTSSKMQCAEVLQLICKQHLIEYYCT